MGERVSLVFVALGMTLLCFCGFTIFLKYYLVLKRLFSFMALVKSNYKTVCFEILLRARLQDFEKLFVPLVSWNVEVDNKCQKTSKFSDFSVNFKII